jgi:hypothetical protein
MEGTGPHPIVAIAALLLGIACGFAGTIKILDMVGELNAKLPGKESYSYLGWYGSKCARFLRDYERYFPNSPNPRYLRTGFIFMMGLMIVVAWGLGFFR